MVSGPCRRGQPAEPAGWPGIKQALSWTVHSTTFPKLQAENGCLLRYLGCIHGGLVDLDSIHTNGQSMAGFACHRAMPAQHTETDIHMAMPAWLSQRRVHMQPGSGSIESD